MEIIHAGLKYDYWMSPGGKLERFTKLVEFSSINDFISYNNVTSLDPTLNSNDWEMQISVPTYQSMNLKSNEANFIYIVESEWGGIVENIEHINGIVKLSGPNFRGYLARYVIAPPVNKYDDTYTDYLNYNGGANAMLWEVMPKNTDTSILSRNYVAASRIGSNKTITAKYRWETYLSGITKELKRNGLRLETKQAYIDYGNQNNYDFVNIQTILFTMSAQAITDYSDDETYSQDFDVTIDSGLFNSKNRKYMWVLGKGELENREVYILRNGLVWTPTKGNHEDSLINAAIYRNSNAETYEELIEDAQAYWQENYAKNEFIDVEVSNTDIEFYLGDIIKAEDLITGLSTQAEITVKELTINNNGVDITYKVGGL